MEEDDRKIQQLQQANFSEIADRFQQISQKMRKEAPAVQTKLIQKQKLMRQQTVEKGNGVVPCQDLPLVE